MVAKKLSPQAYKDLLKTLRTWPSDYTRVIAPLVRHVEALDKKIESLETECRELRQREMFEAPKPYKSPYVEQADGVSTGEYFYTLLFDQDEEKIERAIKWKNKTRQEMLQIANQWAVQSDNPILQG